MRYVVAILILGLAARSIAAVDEVAVMKELTALYKARNLADLERRARELVEKEPGVPVGHLWMGKVEHERRKFAAAERHLIRARDILPKVALFHVALCDLYEDMYASEQSPETKRRLWVEWNTIETLDPKNVDQILHRAFAALQTREMVRAADELERAEKLAPGHPDLPRFQARVGLECGGYFSSQGKDPARAIPLLKKCLALRPKSSDALLFLGISHANLGQEAEAEAALEDCLKLQPAEVLAVTKLFDLHLRAKRIDRAQAVAEAGLRADPESPAIAGCLVRIAVAQGKGWRPKGGPLTSGGAHQLLLEGALADGALAPDEAELIKKFDDAYLVKPLESAPIDAWVKEHAPKSPGPAHPQTAVRAFARLVAWEAQVSVRPMVERNLIVNAGKAFGLSVDDMAKIREKVAAHRSAASPAASASPAR